jgi:hypothetical protein
VQVTTQQEKMIINKQAMKAVTCNFRNKNSAERETERKREKWTEQKHCLTERQTERERKRERGSYR